VCPGPCEGHVIPFRLLPILGWVVDPDRLGCVF
jgi:hypothetical protein